MPIQLAERKGLRARTGCFTCRARHVKCDETKPACKQCGKKRRTCLYDRGLGKSVLERGLPSSGSSLTADPIRGAVPEASESDNYTSCGVEERILAGLPLLPLSQDDQRDVIRISTAPPSTPSLASPSANLASIFDIAGWELEAVESQDSRSVLRTGVPIPLKPIEVTIFRNYVDRVSHWLDAFSRDEPFSSTVPGLALQCPALLYSCLAFSARQIFLTVTGDKAKQYESLSVYYYRAALKNLGDLLASAEYARSHEVLASSMILSSYEMLEVIGENFGSHLKGLAALLQAQMVCGDDVGLRGSIFWAWYRHEIWSCLLTGRRMTLNESYWEPRVVEDFEQMSQEEIANRATFLFGQVVSFCNEADAALQGDDVTANYSELTRLEQALADWERKLPRIMVPFRLDCGSTETSPSQAARYSESNTSIWFIYPQGAIAYQVYHASLILLALHRPPERRSGLALTQLASLSSRRQIKQSREQICLTASSGISEQFGFLSVQCLFIAGLVMEDGGERSHTLELIESCQRMSGRRTTYIANELRKIWGLDI